MASIPSSLKKELAAKPLEASAPCRVDSGGTWDIKAMALPLELIKPVTLNIALNLRTRVNISPFQDGWIKVSSEGFPRGEEYPRERVPFDSPFGLFFAAISHFGVDGIHARIISESPVKSALGGSSTALVALIEALSRLSVRMGQKRLSPREILHLGYHLEDGVSGGNCGIQDQAAAVYGGVNRWLWRYGRTGSLFKREPLLDGKGQRELSKRILVAYSGKSHISSLINQTWIKEFLSGKTRVGWVKVNEIVSRLTEAVKGRKWAEAAKLLRDEMALRREITPDALISITETLIDQAESLGCGARFAGAGAGGVVWALGKIDDMGQLKKGWERTLSPVKGARILQCSVDPVGVK